MKYSRNLIAAVLLIIILMPALFFSVYQISALSESEELIGTVYTRQLDAILFSVNQYLFDVTDSWATRIETALPGGDFSSFTKSSPSIIAITAADSAFRPLRVHSAEDHRRTKQLRDRYGEMVSTLVRYRGAGYRKLETVVPDDSTITVMFATGTRPLRIIAVSIDRQRFVSDIIAKKLNGLAENDILLGVVNNRTDSVVVSTAPVSAGRLSQRRPLWVFPDYSLGIGVRGESLEEIARGRFTRNMILIVIVDLLFIAGAIVVYRTVRREMELIALRSDFVSNVSHELRTPLALIRMFAETLAMNRVPGEKKKKEYYEIILRETERLTRLINNILNFSRMENATRKFQFRPADLNAAVSAVLSVYRHQLDREKFAVTTDLAENLPAVSFDEEAIAEALHNLIDNAIKYSGEKKYLRIRTETSGTGVSISVQDDGIGIAPEHQSHIFEKFFRVTHGLVHTAKGSGLGLSIVRHIAESHGGSVSVVSTVGKGSTFTIHLPLTPAMR